MRSTAKGATVAVVCAAMGAVFGVGGCASDTPTRYFALQAIAPAAASATVASGATSPATAQAGLPLEVSSVQVPPTMDRVELIRQLPQGEVAVRDFAHWAAPLGRMTRQVLTEDLALRLSAEQVIFPGAVGPDLRSTVTVDILSFNVADGTATMRVSWAMRRPVPPSSVPVGLVPSLPASGPRSESLRLVTAAGDGDAATAGAWSALISQLADAIANAALRSSGSRR